MNDAELVTLVLSGKTERFGTLVDRYLPMLRGLCASHVFDASAHEDLVQDGFLYAYEKLDTLRNRSRFGPWLARIGRSLCADWLRSQKRRSNARDRMAAQQRDQGIADARKQVLRRELCQWLRDRIGHLPDKTREAMVLCYIEGLSTREAAQFLGVREPAIKKRLQYGRKLLGEELWAEFGEQPEETQNTEDLKRRVLAALPLGVAPWKAGAGAAGVGIAGGLVTMKTVVVGAVPLAFLAMFLLWPSDSNEEPAPTPPAKAGGAAQTAVTADALPEEDTRPASDNDPKGHVPVAEPSSLTITATYVSPSAYKFFEQLRAIPVVNADILLVPQRFEPASFREFYENAELDDASLDILTRWNYCRPESPDRRREFLAEAGITEAKLSAILDVAWRRSPEMQLAFGTIFPNEPSDTWVQAVTDSKGRAKFAGLAPGRYLNVPRQRGDTRGWDTLVAEMSDDFTYGVTFIRPGRSEVQELRLSDWVSRIHGRVVDGATGEPIKVGLRITGEITGGEDVDFEAQHGTFVARRWLGYGSFQLEVRPSLPGFAYYIPEPIKGKRRLETPIPELVIRLFRGPSISGVVTTADGAPVPYVFIQREYPDKTAAAQLAQTDKEGRYSVKQDGGIYVIRAAADGWMDIVAEESVARSDWVKLELDGDEAVIQDFIFPDTGRIVLHCISPEGAPINGLCRAVVVKYGATREVQKVSPVAVLSNGRLIISNLTPGRYEVYARVEPHDYVLTGTGGYVPVAVDGLVVREDCGDTEATVTLVPATVRQAVRVLHADGAPWQGIHVSASEHHPFNAAGGKLIRGSNLFLGEKTDENGEIILQNLWEGTFTVTALHRSLGPGGHVLMVQIPQDGPIIIQPEVERPRASYAVRAVDAVTGVEVAKHDSTARVFAIGEQGYLEDGPVCNGVCLPKGTHLVVFVKPGHTAAMGWLEAIPQMSQETQEVELEIGAGGSVSGAAATATGELLAGQPLFVYPAEIWELAQWNSESWRRLGRALAQGASTDEEGGFRLRHLPTGQYVVALPETGITVPVEVHAGQESGPLDLQHADQSG